MTSLSNKKVEEILSKGISLDSFGINNWGLTKQQALVAVNKLKQSSIAVLGGDVLKQEKERWIHTYDNWYCNRSPEEANEQFAIRSTQTAIDYIEKYKTKKDMENLFVIVTE